MSCRHLTNVRSTILEVFDGVEFSGKPRNAGSSLIQAKVMGPTCNGIVYEDKVVWLKFDIVGDDLRF